MVETPDSARLMKDALSHPSDAVLGNVIASHGLNKTISTATGLVGYDLQAPGKNLYPFNTPLIKSLPRTPGNGGIGANWVQITGLKGSGFDASGYVPQGQRAGQMSYNASTRFAGYVTLGEEDAATFEAINAARGFEDIRATLSTRLLQKLILKEEMAVLAGNSSNPLGTPAQPVLAASGSGATLPALTYSVIVVALTPEGYANAKAGGWQANGLLQTQTVTGADGKTFSLNGGVSNKSSNQTQAVTLGQSLTASVALIPGAAAYAWYVGAAGSETLQAITTINSAAFAAPLITGRQAASALAATDYSSNPLGMDGFLTWASKPGTGAYYNALATGTAGVGTPLTASGRGTVNEIDVMLQSMWDTYQVSPTVMYVNSQELKNISAKLATPGSYPAVQYNLNVQNGQAEFGVSPRVYYNPFVTGEPQAIALKIHPNVPPGTLMAYAEQLPIQYQSNNVPNVAEVLTRQDYYQIEWPVTTRQQQVGVYTEEVLAMYAPFALGMITNIANG